LADTKEDHRHRVARDDHLPQGSTHRCPYDHGLRRVLAILDRHHSLTSGVEFTADQFPDLFMFQCRSGGKERPRRNAARAEFMPERFWIVRSNISNMLLHVTLDRVARVTRFQQRRVSGRLVRDRLRLQEWPAVVIGPNDANCLVLQDLGALIETVVCPSPVIPNDFRGRRAPLVWRGKHLVGKKPFSQGFSESLLCRNFG
jgi:hypothetical protein